MSLSLPVSGSARGVGRDTAGNASGGDKGVDGYVGRGSTASDIIKSEGCFGEPKGAHL